MLLACALALPHALARPSGDPRRTSASSAPAPSAVIAPAPTHLFRRIAFHARAGVAPERPRTPLVVRRVIAAGNRIARAPYSYGGGHGNWDAGGYDCSGSVSYALHGGGLLDTALASSGFMGWGAPGRGRWITIYANPGHAFMVVAGRRFDTTGRDQTGSRWQPAMRDTSSYVARHPPGL